MSSRELVRLLMVIVVVPLVLLTQHSSASAQSQVPADVRAVLEGTWELVEWHVDGKVLRSPQAGGRWSNHDGVVIWIVWHTVDGKTDSQNGYGKYRIDAKSFSYGYERMVTTSESPSSPTKLTVSTPNEELRPLVLTREGNKMVSKEPIEAVQIAVNTKVIHSCDFKTARSNVDIGKYTHPN